jgi:deoxyribodipyrimidine photo-lyase
MVDAKRVHTLRDGWRKPGPIVYWMSRDQRVANNWALLFAQQMAIKQKVPLLVVFCLVPEYLGATSQQYEFMLRGLRETEENLRTKSIGFEILEGVPKIAIPHCLNEISAGGLICDFSPLRINRSWKADVAESISIPLFEVDAHNIVPCWIASSKQEYAARTIRPKIRKALKNFLTEYPRLKPHPHAFQQTQHVEWDRLFAKPGGTSKGTLRSMPESGAKAAAKTLQLFLRKRIQSYETGRNDPTENAQSDLSPYLHFGQISAQQVVMDVHKKGIPRRMSETFLEELVVRRELSDNFCFYNPRYDSVEGFPQWAKETLEEHRGDERPYLYSHEQLESASTHDALWNAAQKEMMFTGKMHGYMRMYWAKKILEWSPSPESAMEIAIALNDRYELDGRDPNGYAGIAWSIGGVHDRPWFERPVFGKIRYMSYNGCKAKFNVEAYIARIESSDPQT